MWKAIPVVGNATCEQLPCLRPFGEHACCIKCEIEYPIHDDPDRGSSPLIGDRGVCIQAASLRPVLLAVVVASMGAFAFGYHLAVLNGPLQAISADLGFAGKPALEGLVRFPWAPFAAQCSHRWASADTGTPLLSQERNGLVSCVTQLLRGKNRCFMFFLFTSRLMSNVPRA